jgi:DNA-binding CsgD family transcriptional regulator
VDLLGCYSKRTAWLDTLPTSGNAAPTVRRPPRPAPRPPLKQLSKSPDEALARDYAAGATVYELSQRYGMHRNTVSQHLHRLGVEMRRRGLTTDQASLAADLYRRGQSLARIGDRLAVTPMTVRAALLAKGIPTRDPQGRQQPIAPSRHEDHSLET